MNPLISLHRCAFLVLVLFAGQTVAASISTLDVRGKNIQVGQSADEVFAILPKSDMLKQDVSPNPRGGLFVHKHYKVQGKEFTLKMALIGGTGPYVVTHIITNDPVKSVKSAGISFPLAQFEGSPFYRKLAPSRNSWKLATGGTNYSYSSADPEHQGERRSIELSGTPANIRAAGLSWQGRSVLKPAQLTSVKERHLTEFLEAVMPQLKPGDVLRVIRRQQSKRYPGGSGDMPRTVINGIPVYAGINGETLIIGFGSD